MREAEPSQIPPDLQPFGPQLPGRRPAIGPRRAMRYCAWGMIVLGCLCLLYTPLAYYLSSRGQYEVVQAYSSQIQGLSAQQRQEERALAMQYNRLLAASGYTPRLAEEYSQLLAAAKSMGVLRIEAIDLVLPIYHGVSDAVLRQGVGHLPFSSLPVGGKGSHAALTAHSGLATAELFSNLQQLQLGDCLQLEVLGQSLYYQVVRIDIVSPDDLSLLQPVAGKDYLTLITCTPAWVNSHRLLVRGERCSAPSELPLPVTGSGWAEKLAWSGVGLLLLLLLLALYCLLASLESS